MSHKPLEQIADAAQFADGFHWRVAQPIRGLQPREAVQVVATVRTVMRCSWRAIIRAIDHAAGLAWVLLPARMMFRTC